MKNWTIFTEETTFNFGKHAGTSLEEVAKKKTHDTSYGTLGKLIKF